MISPFITTVLLVLLSGLTAAASPPEQAKTCTVKSGGSNETDDAPAIIQAFRECAQDATVIFEPTTYHVNSVMNITWLQNVKIDLQGTLSVSSSTHQYRPELILRISGGRISPTGSTTQCQSAIRTSLQPSSWAGIRLPSKDMGTGPWTAMVMTGIDSSGSSRTPQTTLVDHMQSPSMA